MAAGSPEVRRPLRIGLDPAAARRPAIPVGSARRARAWIVDGLLVYTVAFVGLGVAMELLGTPLVVPADDLAGSVEAALASVERVAATYLALAVAYGTLCDARFGRTLGKRLTKLRVIDEADGGRPTLGRALVRNLLKACFLVFVVGSRDRGLHDRAGRTRVVDA